MIKTSLAILSLAFVAACAATPVADLPERRGATLPAALPPMAMFGTPRPVASTRSNTVGPAIARIKASVIVIKTAADVAIIT